MAVKGLQLGRKVKAKPTEETQKVEQALQKEKTKKEEDGQGEVKVLTSEKVSCSINKEGGLESLTIQGEVTISNPGQVNLGVQLNQALLSKM